MYMIIVRDVPSIVLLRELNHDNGNIMCKPMCGSKCYWSHVILVGGSKIIRILTGLQYLVLPKFMFGFDHFVQESSTFQSLLHMYFKT
jgi:hypothetical protein